MNYDKLYLSFSCCTHTGETVGDAQEESTVDADLSTAPAGTDALAFWTTRFGSLRLCAVA